MQTQNPHSSSSPIKGIILAGGRGTRLYPLTAIVSKQLQPVYNKPMVYYPLTTMLLAGVKEILLISTPQDLPRFRELLGTGTQWGIRLDYAEQAEPRGIAEALIIAETFLGESGAFLMLGDNLIYGHLDFLRETVRTTTTDATIFGYQVSDPTRYGVVDFDAQTGKAISIEEKPKRPKSPWAVPGMYVYPPGVSEKAKALVPSARGELEITDLNRLYLADGHLQVKTLGRGYAWFDTGTPQSLLDAAEFVHAIEERQGLIIGCPEEAALRMGYLSKTRFTQTVEALPACPYRDYLARLAETFSG